MRRAERDDGPDPRVRGPNYANGRIHTAAAGAVQRIFVQPRSIFRHPIQIGAGSAQPLGPHTASGQPPSGAGGSNTPRTSLHLRKAAGEALGRHPRLALEQSVDLRTVH